VEAIRRPPQEVRHEGLIINTCIKATNEGKAENTVKAFSHRLTQLSRKADLTKPEEVKTAIANATNHKTGKPLNNSTKSSLCLAYEWFCKTNNLQWQKPNYKWEEGTPIIPTTEQVTKIISASTKRFATIYTIMTETGIEGEELHRLHKNQIDTERGIISIKGTKGHNAGTYKLKNQTAEMLREYLGKDQREYPFPQPKVMSEQWRTARDRLADNLKQPDLKKIPMKNLRNYSGAHLYLTLPIRDPIAVMRHLRHKKLETTMHYLRGITLTIEEDANYICRTTNNIKEDTELIENGFTFVTERDGIKLYRKRK
jgi:integrase